MDEYLGPWETAHLPDILWDNRELVRAAYRDQSLDVFRSGMREESLEILCGIEVLDRDLRMLPAFRKALASAIGDGLSGLSLEEIMYKVAEHHTEWFRQI